MNEAAIQSGVDSRREVDRWLGNYSEDHRNATNTLIHWICVPAILWSGIAALWTVPVPVMLGRPGFWAGVAMFVSMAFYLRLSRPLGFVMLLAFVLLGVGRFLHLVKSRPKSESPTQEMLHDGPFVAIVLFWVVLVMWVVYRLKPSG